MGSGTSRLETRGWEAEVQQKLETTKHKSKVVVICSLIPGVDETAMVGCLKKRPDLDTLFELYCRPRNIQPKQQANLTVDSKADELWKALHMPLASDTSPWDLTWSPPFKGSPSKIAAEIHSTVCRAIFHIPFFDFVKYALGYNTEANFLISLYYAISDARDRLRTAFQDRPMIRGIYIEVEKALTQQHHPLAQWIITSGLEHTSLALNLHDALASNLNSIQAIFRNRNLDVVLKRLTALYHRFSHISQKYHWQKWSTDLDFWECVDQTLWSGKYTIPSISPQLSTVDQAERLYFLEGFNTAIKHCTWGGRVPHYSIRQGLEMSGLVIRAIPKRPATSSEMWV